MSKRMSRTSPPMISPHCDTNFPHDKLKTRMADVISKAYEGSGKTYISVYSTSASFANKHKKDTKAYTKDCLLYTSPSPRDH